MTLNFTLPALSASFRREFYPPFPIKAKCLKEKYVRKVSYYKFLITHGERRRTRGHQGEG